MVDRRRQPAGSGPDHRNVDHRVDVDVRRSAVDARRDVLHRGCDARRGSQRRHHRESGVAREPGEHGLADLRVRLIDAGGHAHPIEEVPDGHGERIDLRRDDLDRVDFWLGHRRPPVREELRDRRVELFVARTAGLQQVGIELPAGHPDTQHLGVQPEPLPVRGDQPPGGRHDGPPPVQGREERPVGQLRLGDQQSDGRADATSSRSTDAASAAEPTQCTR